MRFRHVMIAVAGLMLPATPSATETTTFRYDTQGRLIQSFKSGGPANGIQTTNSYDLNDNRCAQVVETTTTPGVTATECSKNLSDPATWIIRTGRPNAVISGSTFTLKPYNNGYSGGVVIGPTTPYRGKYRIMFDTSAPADDSVGIFDAYGSLVISLGSGPSTNFDFTVTLSSSSALVIYGNPSTPLTVSNVRIYRVA